MTHPIPAVFFLAVAAYKSGNTYLAKELLADYPAQIEVNSSLSDLRKEDIVLFAFYIVHNYECNLDMLNKNQSGWVWACFQALSKLTTH